MRLRVLRISPGPEVGFSLEYGSSQVEIFDSFISKLTCSATATRGVAMRQETGETTTKTISVRISVAFKGPGSVHTD